MAKKKLEFTVFPYTFQDQHLLYMHVMTVYYEQNVFITYPCFQFFC